MGNTQSFQNVYSIPLKDTHTSPDLTPILRAATHPDALVETFRDEACATSWDLFQRGKRVDDGRRLCLGHREPSAKDGTVSAHYTWMTYREVEASALAIGTTLLRSGHVDPIEYDDEVYTPAQKLRLLGVFSKNRVEWFVCEQAANAYAISLVPLYDTLGNDALAYILERTRMRIVACSLECLVLLISGIEATRHVRSILMFLYPHETMPKDLLDRCRAAGVTEILYYNHILKTMSTDSLMSPCPGGPDDINTVCFTSGTTGRPKGVFLTHRNMVSCVAGLVRGPIAQDFDLNSNDITISYLPLAHVLERAVCNTVLAIGAAIGVYSGDTMKLLDDVRCLNPTIFVSVPRLYNRINDAITHGVTEKSALARFLFARGRTTKLANLRHNATTSNRVWDSLVFNKTKHLMGTRLRYMISGGAPLDALVQEHIKILFCSPLMEGYGLTETIGPAFLANPLDPVAGHIGGPIPCVEFRLQSVPEICYNVDDVPPRGELLIRGHSVTPGYFRDAGETELALDPDGWFHTGDIALLLPGGSVKIIDRKKNIFKLSQGEYVAPEKVEAVYVQAPLVSQIFVFGYSDKNSLVAIVVPDQPSLEAYAKKNGKSKLSFSALCKMPDIKTAILKDMEVTAQGAQLKGFEKVKDIYVEEQPFTVENNLLTPTLKIRRHEAKKMYEKEIDSMYEHVY